MPAAGDALRWRASQVDLAPIHGVVGHVAIDGDLGEVGAEDVRQRLQDDGGERDAGLPLVGAQILEQAAHEPAVIRLADDVVFVGGGLRLRLLLRMGLLRAAGPGFGHAFLYFT